MTNINKETLDLLELLPNEEQILAKEFVKRMVLAWDSDYTRVTPKERKEIEIAEKEIENGEFYTQEEVLEILGVTLG